MTKSPSLTTKAATAAKKKAGKLDLFQSNFTKLWYLLYCMLSREFVVCLPPFFISFLDEQRHRNCAVIVWLDNFLDLVIALYLASTKKVVPSPPTVSVVSVVSTLTSTWLSMNASIKSSLLTMVKSAQKLVLGSPKLSTKLPAYQINWLNYNNIRCRLVKYTKEGGRSGTIKEDLLSLLSKFCTSEIKFALVATLSKLELGIEELPVRKNKLIELFPQLILNNMFILGNSTKSAEQCI